MNDLTGKTALVTGGTRGIGLAIAESLVAAGASVVISGRDSEAVAAVAAGLSDGSGAKVVGLAADLTDPSGCEQLVSSARAELGSLDILVNNAGIGVFKSIEEMTWEEFRAQIDLNLGAVWSITKAALPHLKLSEFAWVINIGSLASRNSFAKGTGYNASKFGLLGMTEAMMLDLRAEGIRVSLVMPGSVNTEFGGKTPVAERDWRLEAEDCALAVMQLLAYPAGAHVSRIEMRPAVTS